ncbi:MAG TPA: RagB/SusD family nutrient uptake outer membrane protein [Arachidicoccus sp.]|nr:RagB/SusD family nutrient uptake outer membrane protein [Arachidicoccus sp.]
MITINNTAILVKRLLMPMLIILLLLLGSCKKDFLDVNNIQAQVSTDALYRNYNYAQQAVWNTYSYLPDGLADLDLEAATDDAEATVVSDRSQAFNDGTWDQYSQTDDSWSRDFDGIRQANLYLKNRDKVDISYLKDRITSTDSTTYFNARDNVKFMQGEVYFLKAYFYFDLVKHYGGVPIMKSPLDYQQKNDWKGIQRSSVDECLRYISALCDSAAAIIPEDLSPYSWYDLGRVTYGAIKALQSRTLLYGASPLYKDAGSTVTWEEAAAAAHNVINLHAYALDGNYSNLYGSGNTGSAELIFYKRYGAIHWPEQDNFPIAFQNSGGRSIAPTQDFVDAFEVQIMDDNGAVTGSRPFDWNNPVDAAHPYEHRDPRLSASVIYNGRIFSSLQIDTYTGGNSGLPKLNATKTGYYLCKWINPTIDLVNETSANHAWIYFRYGEILLNYAEAMYHAYGAEGDTPGYGLTALDAINLVRARAGMPPLTATALTETSIEHERKVELGFEGHRLWDVRRWKEGAVFNQPVHRIDITKKVTGLTYEVKKLENRRFEDKMYWYPIAQDEITKTGWAQNAGW